MKKIHQMIHHLHRDLLTTTGLIIFLIALAACSGGNGGNGSDTGDVGDTDSPKDETPPEISIVSPSSGAASTPTPTINITFSDAETGIDTKSLRVTINDHDITALFTVTPDGANGTILDALPSGENQIVVTIKDNSSNTATATADFMVRKFSSALTASPTSGNAPLTVNFYATAEEISGTVIQEYSLTFGDGNEVPPENPSNCNWKCYGGNYSYTYQKSGTYEAVLTATNADGEEVTARVTINVMPSPPEASAELSPSNGEVPLTVNFDGFGADPDGEIVLYEWDFDGDGAFDYANESSGTTSHEFTNEGVFNAVFRVTDNDGLTDTAEQILTAVRIGPPGSPSATASANPDSGDAPLEVSFRGYGYDSDGRLVSYEWDFDGDGNFDWLSEQSGHISYSYTMPGTYFPAFRVTDDAGLQNTDYMVITVGLDVGVFFSDEDRTFNPTEGETIDILPVLSASVPATLKLKNRDGGVVRSMPVPSDGTTLSIPWDGRDGDGFVVPDGTYFVVLEYRLGDETEVFDPTLSTGSGQYDPTQDTLPTTPYVFYPFDDENLPIGFTLTEASEVSIYLGCFEEQIHVRTLVNRVPFGAGHHILYWDGMDDDGYLANHCPGANQVIYGVNGFTLPDNAIIAQGSRPVISDLAADPNYLSTFSRGKLDTSIIKIGFKLSELSSVTMNIYPVGDDRAVRTFTQNNLSAGDHIFNWDVKNSSGKHALGGDYRISVKARDMEGNSSMEMHTAVRISY